MEIDVKGHSGCQIDVVREGKELFVFKSSKDPKYLGRLVLQAEKQKAAAMPVLQHIRVPKIHEIVRSDEMVSVKMDYVYSRNFIEFFEQAGFEQVNYLIKALIKYLEFEIEKSRLVTVKREIVTGKFDDVKKKTLSNKYLEGDEEIIRILSESQKVFDELPDMKMPVGICHGDLTFSNILFNGNNYYLIDFLDSFIESPLLDIVKLRQDTAWLWSQLMYVQPFDSIRLRIAFQKIDSEIDSYFSSKCEWYTLYYKPLQLMNFLRILQYAHEPKVIDYLKILLMSNSGKFSLIVPVAADKPEYAGNMPYVFAPDRDGTMLCVKAIKGLNLGVFDDIYFTILRKHAEMYDIDKLLELQFRRNNLSNAKIVILDTPTATQAETIERTIRKENVEGAIYIKDADGYFHAELLPENSVAVYPLEQLDLVDPRNKSYVSVDDMQHITNIIEKRVVSNLFNAGGYCFENVEDFIEVYNRHVSLGHIYLSHLIYSMLLEGHIFRPTKVTEYNDWNIK